MTKKWIVNVTIGIIVTVGVYACQKDSMGISSPLSNVWSLVSSDAPLMEMTYETEITSYQKVLVDRASAEHKFFDLVAAQPTVKRQVVVFRLKNDGATYIETTELAPLHPAPTITHLSLPNNLPKVKKTIIEGTTMKLYGDEGNLLRTETIGQAITNPQLVESIQKMKLKANSNEMSEAVSTMQLSRMFSLNVVEMEQQANANGGSVTIQGRMKLVKTPYNNPNDPRQKSMIMSIDNVKNIPIFIDITDINGKSIISTSYRYENMTSEFPILKDISTNVYAVSSTGSDIVQKTIMSISNVSSVLR